MEFESGKKSSITFLGHSSALISIGATRILTDPNLSRRIALFFRRRSRPPLKADDLPSIDLTLISHGHYDHLDLPTLRKLPQDGVIVVPPGLERVVKRAGKRRLVTLSPWETHTEKNVIITAVPAKHFAGRPPFRLKTGYQGYIIEGSAVIYFAGDTAWFEGFSDIGEKWDIDAALLPIGAYQPPRFRENHMAPEDAVQAARALKAKMLIPIHWGAFKLSLESLSEPIPRLQQAAEQAGIGEKVRVLKPGESIVLPERISS
jgi:L-ascorbate metabolism protein UlaG (beta-lactamase superfamily)